MHACNKFASNQRSTSRSLNKFSYRQAAPTFWSSHLHKGFQCVERRQCIARRRSRTHIADQGAAVAYRGRPHDSDRLPKVVTTTVDFARSGQPRDTWAAAEVTRLGRRLATVAVRLWQEDPGRAIATGQAHFLLS